MKEVRVCEAMKSPVGTLSDGTVLRQQDGGTKSRQVPIWEKSNLTLEEAAAYSGIGINKLRSLSDIRSIVSSCCGWGPIGSSSGASWMNTRSECTRFENVPDIFQNVLQRMAYLWYYEHRTTLFSVPQCRKEQRSWQQIRIRNARTRRVWFSARANPSAKMASTISVGLLRMASDILFMPRPWRNFGKRKKTSSWIHWKASRLKRGMSP